jgi:hypothetical protein
MKALWPDSFVEDSNLTQQISMIRKALGESPGEDRYIVTVQGRGYRFAASVKVFSNRNSQTDAVAPQVSDRQDKIARTETGAASPEGLTNSSGLQPSSRPEAGGRKVLELRIALPVLVLGLAVLALVYSLHRNQSSGAQTISRSAEPRDHSVPQFETRCRQRLLGIFAG